MNQTLKGNWKKQYDDLECFGINSPEDWALVPLDSKHSGLADKANAKSIEKAMNQYVTGDNPSAKFEKELGHWHLGTYNIMLIRVEADGEQTPAYDLYLELCDRLESEMVLDERDHESMIYDATLKNIESMSSFFKMYDLPDNWPVRVYDWLYHNNKKSLEDQDDRGGCPSKDVLLTAFTELFNKRIQPE